jgi:hypothetical protein
MVKGGGKVGDHKQVTVMDFVCFTIYTTGYGNSDYSHEKVEEGVN